MRRPSSDLQILYSLTRFTRGEAWNHLWENLPVITLDHKTFYSPFFEPLLNSDGSPKRTKFGVEARINPYRKAHTDYCWVWSVTSWTERHYIQRPKKPKLPPKTRYDILDTDWLEDK